jgi:beta-galactosidase
VRDLGLDRCLNVDLPEGVTVQRRSGGKRSFLFVHNFKRIEQTLDIGGLRLRDLMDGSVRTGRFSLPGYTSLVLEAVS